MPKQRAAHASTRQPRQASTQLSSFSEARAEVLRGSQRGEASTSKHQKEADNLARIDRKIEATLRPAPPEAASSSLTLSLTRTRTLALSLTLTLALTLQGSGASHELPPTLCSWR